MMKNQKGITLIALVITIIVLLILAGVSIAMLTGENGILTQATESKAANAKAEAVEKINLALNAIKTEIYAQQVVTSNWDPEDASGEGGLKQAISDLIVSDFKEGTTDLAEVNTASVDDKYTYSVTDHVLSIKYKSATKGVSEIEGKIDLQASSNYKITEAK